MIHFRIKAKTYIENNRALVDLYFVQRRFFGFLWITLESFDAEYKARDYVDLHKALLGRHARILN